MFKELKVIKLIVFVGLLVMILSKLDVKDGFITNLYTDNISYFSNQAIKIHSSSNSFFSLEREIPLTDIMGNEVTTLNIKLTSQTENEKPLRNGLGYKKYLEYMFPENTKSGIYLIDKKYPVIIKSKKPSDITVVYPYGNNVLYESYNNKNVFSLKEKKASLNRTSQIDVYSLGLKSLFNSLNDLGSVNYITDLDIENLVNFDQSKILILYGKSSCWTPKMKSSLTTYISNGGNVLMMSTYGLNNVCWYKRESNTITMYNDTSASMISWLNYNGAHPEKSVGISYTNGGYSDNSFYYISDKTHPILKGVDQDTLNLKANLYSSPPVKWVNNSPKIDLASLNFYSGEILAYEKASFKENDNGIKGIFVLQPDSNSGKIISLGTEDWCLKENYEENKSIQMITENAIKFLLK
jgi:hypothetical protein